MPVFTNERRHDNRFSSLLRGGIIFPITQNNKKPTLLFLMASIFITGLAFAIRLHHLGGDSFWIDEILTVETIHEGWWKMLNVRSHPPLLYLLGFLSIGQFGETSFALRLPSLYAGVLAIPFMIGLGRAMGRPGAGLLAALLLALSPLHLRFSQEARHYALLMTFSLAAYLLLYRAWRRPTWRWWLGYALATSINLYSHYAAFIVLATQMVLIAVWSLIQMAQRRFRRLLYPAGTALTVILLYAFRLHQVQRALLHNIGPTAGTNAFNNPTPLIDWVRNMYAAFAAFHPVWQPVMVIFILLGLLVLLRRREWLNLGFVGIGLVVPLLLIVATQIDRSAFPRYIIYLLPFYLLAAAFGLVAVPAAVQRQWGRPAGLAAGSFLVVGLLVFSSPLIQAEHELEIRDWRGVMEAVADQARPGDLVLPLMLSFNSDWNSAEVAANYYRSIAAPDITVLPAYQLRRDESDGLSDPDRDVWVVMTYWAGEVDLPDPDLVLDAFQSDTYLLHNPHLEGSTVEKVAYYYALLLPLASEELPACLMQQNLAALEMHSGDYLRAAQLLGEPVADCSRPEGSEQAMWQDELLAELFPPLQAELAARLVQEDGPAAGQVAEMILRVYPEDQTALSVLEVANLLDWFAAGRAQVESNAPEPVRRETFWMPYNQPDDEGDVLFLHAPGRVTYTVTLPSKPALLHFRVGMASHSWDWGGDGSTFVVRVKTESGETETLYERHVSNEAQDRYWHPAEVSLAPFAGQEIVLTLETTPGPNQDTTGDWALWDSPRIIFALQDG
jgi:hypothetical protein